MLYVVYSRFYLGRCTSYFKQQSGLTASERAEQCPGLTSVDQGIKMAEVDLSRLDSLPQMRLPGDSLRPRPTKRQLYGMLHHFINTEVRVSVTPRTVGEVRSAQRLLASPQEWPF